MKFDENMSLQLTESFPGRSWI